MNRVSRGYSKSPSATDQAPNKASVYEGNAGFKKLGQRRAGKNEKSKQFEDDIVAFYLRDNNDKVIVR